MSLKYSCNKDCKSTGKECDCGILNIGKIDTIKNLAITMINTKKNKTSD